MRSGPLALNQRRSAFCSGNVFARHASDTLGSGETPGAPMDTILNDLRYALRVLARNPCLTAISILPLALGIGANPAIFSVVNAVLLRPLDFRDPARLVIVWHVPPPKSFPGMTEFAVSAANFIDWQKQNHV